MISALSPTTIPIFIELRTITDKRSLSDAISMFLLSIGIKDDGEIFDYLAHSKKIVLLLDGFDEVPSGCVKETILQLDYLQTKHPSLRIIVSSRPRSHIQNAPGFEVIKLEPLKTADYDLFVSRLIASKTKRADVISALNDCEENIKGVIHTPLMLTLVVMIYQTEKEIPTTLADFFDKLFGTVFSKHDKLKAGFNRQHHTELSESSLKELFETFCFMTIQQGVGRSMSSAKFDKIFREAISYASDLKCRNEDFREDIIKVACLMLEEGLDMITFLHKSILDYHAAAFVRDLSDEQIIDFYLVSFENYGQWEHVLQFLKTIDPVRYAREYTLKNLPVALEELNAIINKKNTNDLITYLEKLLPNAVITVSSGGKKEFSRTTISSCELHLEIINSFSTAIFKILNRSSKDELIRAATLSRSEPPRRGYPYELSLRSVVTELGDDEIWELLNIAAFSSQLLLDSAKESVEKENQKSRTLKGMLLKKPQVRLSGA
ncbi:hypothetical protein BBG20_13835 [Pseudomonas aylmerensis]|nr:hypothetical protein BBG20_13835 [Pseudomonas aylmerensis]